MSSAMPERIRPAAVTLAAIALLAAACGGGGRRPRNVVLVTLDTMRADYVGAYPGGKARTPALDALAARSTVVENAWSLIPITLPSHASMLFSQPPHLLTDYNNGQPVRPTRAHPSLANLMRRKGFTTAAFVSLGVLERRFGLADGFGEYADEFPRDRWYLTAEEVDRGVLPWIERNKDRKFFLWVHYSDPHEPYALPDAPDDVRVFLNDTPVAVSCFARYLTFEVPLALRAGRNVVRFQVTNPFQPDAGQFKARLDRLDFDPPADEAALRVRHPWGWYVQRDLGKFFLKDGAEIEIVSRAARTVRMTARGSLLVPPETIREVTPRLYRSKVEYMDAWIGKLWETLDRCGLSRDTAVVVVGDHGEGLGEYSNALGDAHIGHVHFLQDIYLKVPFIVHRPGRRPERRAGPATLLDVAPTICGLAGIEPPPGAAGRDLLRTRDDPAAEVRQYTFRPEAVQDRFAIRTPRWHMIFTPDGGGYDLYDVVADPAERVNAFGRPGLPPEVEDLRKAVVDFTRDVLKTKVDVAVDEKAEEMLKSLGYLR